MSDTQTAIRSFIDLAAFAAASPLVEASGDAAWLTNRDALELPEGPVSVALLRLSGEGEVAKLPADEFVIVLDGALLVRHGGEAQALAAKASMVIPGGTGFAWTAASGTSVLVMRCASGPAGAVAPVPIDEAADLVPSGAPLAELLVGETPSCRNFTDYRSANGEFVCGTWDSTPYHRLSMPYRHYELMHLTDGAVTFVDGAGREATFAQGDVFLVEQGAHCSWDSRVHVKKVYAIYRPA